jgi:hypothetical protein
MRWWCLLLLVGCSVELDDVPGRACDEEHPCRAPRACLAGQCWAPEELDAGAQGGGAGGGGGSSTGGGTALGGGGGGGSGVDAGAPRWQQRLHGFTGTTVDPGCTVDIDPSRGNRVVSTVPGSRDDQDTATADLVDPNRLPRTLEGRLRGRLTLAAPLQVRGTVPVVFLGTQTGVAWARVAFDAQGALVVESDAQTVGSAALVERFSIDGGFTAGDWLVEVAWQRGSFRQVKLNEQLVSLALLSGGGTLPPDELRLGIARYDGDAGTAFTVTLSSWQLADDLSVSLGDMP